MCVHKMSTLLHSYCCCYFCSVENCHLLNLWRVMAWMSTKVSDNKSKKIILTAFCKSKFRPLCMLWALILPTTFNAIFVLVPELLLLLLLIWLGIVQIFSLGLSLPTETGRGLSEHGEASRDTDSESSSLNGFPVVTINRITLNI